MASTYSPSLKLTLIGDGDQSGLWGQTTNTNLGTLLEQAVAGVTSIVMADANYTLSNFNGVSNEARNAVLVVSGANNAVRDLIPPVVKKVYIVVNNTTGGYAIRVIGASGTGVFVPNGAACLVYCDGINFFSGLSGTIGAFNINGALTYGGVTLSNSVTGTGSMVLSASPALTGTPTAPTAAPGTDTTQVATTAFVTAATGALGTMASQNANNVSITGGTITGITDLAVADGGTGQSSYTSGQLLIGNSSGGLTKSTLTAGSNVTITNGNGSITIAAAGPGGGGTVTSVATGNGLTGGTITTSGTISIAAPSAGSVGSYVIGGNINSGGIGGTTFTFNFGSSYAAGTSSNQVQNVVMTDAGNSYSNDLSGTWRWLSVSASTSGTGILALIGLMVRVA